MFERPAKKLRKNNGEFLKYRLPRRQSVERAKRDFKISRSNLSKLRNGAVESTFRGRMKINELVVLLAEDLEDDILFFQRAITKVAGTHKIQVVTNGEEAIQYLRGDGIYADRSKFPFPNMLLLDIKMPRKTGLDVLEWLKNHPDCSVIPTVIFTSSDQPQDIKKAYNLGANAFFTKPLAFDKWVELMDLIFGYWCHSHVPEPPPQHACR